ncbi:HlyD family secretion protein [Glaciecola sp. 1036]|uniref:HlyD family secretion protein n=1 Tax=Alteromonadaceae TaxID=72275 RepID=UPI003D087DB4
MFKANLKFLLVLCALLGLTACGEEENLTKTTKESVERAVTAPAELVSLQEVSISPPNIPRTWEYKIEFLARENSIVKEGDLVVKFDAQSLRNDLIGRNSELEAQIKEAEQIKLKNNAELEQLTLDLAEAKKNMNIAKRKVEITDVSRSEIERKKQQAEFKITTELYNQAIQRVEQHKTAMVISEQVQQAKIEKAKFRVEQINDSIAKLSITAPKSGMVTLIPDGEDEKPAIGDTVFMGRRLMSLPALDNIAVKVEFDESVTSQVQLGDEVRVTLVAFPEKPFKGRITELGQAYRFKSQNNLKVVFDAWVTLDQMDLAIMRPGMKATVELAGDKA